MKKRFLGLLLTAAMCLSLLPSMALAEEPAAQTQELTEQENPVAEEEPAEEIFAEETEQEEPAATQEIAEQGIAVQAEITIYPDDVDANGDIVTSTGFSRSGPVLTANDTNLSGQYYIVQKNMTINGDLTVDGNKNGGLVLCKGVTLTVTGALKHTGGTSFFIYGQSNNGADVGRLIIQNSNGDGAAIRSTANNSQLCISSGELELHDGGTGKLVDKVALHSSSPSIHKGTLDNKMIPLDDWSYKSSISGRELVIEYCEHNNATYESAGDTQHTKHCADCGFVGTAVACGNNGSIGYVSDGDVGHYQKCACGNKFGDLVEHTMIAVPKDSTYHITGCQYCDYTSGSRENHVWDNSKGECTVCHFAPVAEDGYNNSFESVTEALEAVAKDGGNNYVQLNVSGYTGGSKTKIDENIVFNQPGKTVELRMNGHTLENDGGPVITVEAGTLKITGTAIINQTGTTTDLAAPAIKVTGGKLIIEGDLTAHGGTYPSANITAQNPAVYADGGELEFQGNLNLQGGLKITGDAKLTQGLTQGTFSVDTGVKNTKRLSVEGSKNYKYLRDLLADNHAFVDKDTNRYLVASFDYWTGDADILTHTHTWAKPTSGDIYTCTVCGVACAHEGGYKTGKCEVCGKPCPHEIADQSPVDHYYYCNDCGQKMAARIQTDTYKWAHYTDLVTAAAAVEDGKTITLLDDIDNSGKYILITGDNKTVTLDLHGHTINGGYMQVGIDRNWNNYTSITLKIVGNGSIQTSGNLSVGYSATLDLSGWTGGEIAKIGMQKNGKITPNPESLLIVGENIGTIGTLGFYSWPSAGVKTKLNGGTYGQISIVVQYTSEPFGSLLAEGYAFQYIDSGKFVEYTKTATNQGNTISNVKVVRCPHEKVENGTCAYCGKTGIAATVDGVVYGSFADALAAMKDKGESTLKLYANATYTESALNSNNLNYTKLTIDLNGYSLSGADNTSKLIQVIDGAELIIKDSSESKNGSVDNIQVTIGVTNDSTAGKLTLESGAIDTLQVSPDSEVTLMAGGKLKYLTTGGSSYSFRIKRLFDENGCYLKDENGNVADLSAISVGSPNNNGYYTVTKSPATITVDTTTDRIPLGKNRVPFGVSVTPTDSTASVKFDWYIDATGSDATTPALVSYTATAAENGTYIYDTTAAGSADAWNGLQKDDKRDLCCIVTALDAEGNVLWSAATASHTLTIDPPSVEDAEITFTEGWQVKTFWPDANNNSVGNTEISSALGAYTVTLNGIKLTEGTDYTVSGNIATEIGTHDLTITGIAPNYSGTKTVQWRVVPHKLKMLEIKQSEKQYDGTDALPDEAFSEYFNSADSYGHITLKEGTDYVVTDARFDTPDASSENKSYRYTVELKNPNYVFEDGTRVKTAVYGEEAHTTVSINKADAPIAIEHGALTVTNKRAGEYTVDLASLLPALNTPMRYGNVTYAVGDISLGEYYNAENSAARIEDGKLILPIQKVSTNEEKAIGTVKVTVSSENIADFTLTIDVSAVRGKSGGSGGGDSTKYTVTTPSSTNGKVTLDKTDAAEGTVVSITPKADEGYVLDTIKAVDKDGNRIKLTAQADGTYTFTMPASQVKIETTFKQAAEDEKPTDENPTEDNPTDKAFADVPADAWFRKAVDYVSGKGLMSGVDQDTFAPTLLTNRAMLVTILWRMEGSPTSEQATTFKDVKANDYFYNAVLWAAENKIVSGVSDTSFAPNDSITREQLAAILYRYAVYKGYDVTQGGMAVREFSDYESISDYARGSVAWAVNTGIVSGKGNNTLDPKGVATRAEVASMLMRFCENIAK